ncbi:MAG: hypothetical protein AB1768_16215 [Pseudomonadota bacterium]|jgi:hypothetical protein
MGGQQFMALFENNTWYELGTPESPTRGKELLAVEQWRGLAAPAQSARVNAFSPTAGVREEVLVPGNVAPMGRD